MQYPKNMKNADTLIIKFVFSSFSNILVLIRNRVQNRTKKVIDIDFTLDLVKWFASS
jgi:hypothetical protein